MPQKQVSIDPGLNLSNIKTRVERLLSDQLVWDDGEFLIFLAGN